MTLRVFDVVAALLGKHPTSRKIFVIGSGRSGTHWIGYILAGHPGIGATIEKPAIFRLSTELAVNPRCAPVLTRRLLVKYRLEHAKVAPRHYLDKSHPNVWHVETLAAAFPTSVFVGILREPYGTVASMLKHPGVRRWCERWEDYPVPNLFLGIREGEHEWYRSLSLTARCAQRWVSHRDRLRQLAASPLRDRIMVVSYEELMLDTTRTLEKLSRWLELSPMLSGPPPRSTSLDKWRDTLTEADIADIESITGVAPPPWPAT